MESDVCDSKCDRAFYSHHIDLKKHFYTFIHINNYCNCNFVILIDNKFWLSTTNLWLSTQSSDCQHKFDCQQQISDCQQKFLIVNNKFLIVNTNFWLSTQISDCQQQISDCQQKYLLLLTCLAFHTLTLSERQKTQADIRETRFKRERPITHVILVSDHWLA